MTRREDDLFERVMERALEWCYSYQAVRKDEDPGAAWRHVNNKAMLRDALDAYDREKEVVDGEA
jgi:hypothetical protein